MTYRMVKTYSDRYWRMQQWEILDMGAQVNEVYNFGRSSLYAESLLSLAIRPLPDPDYERTT